MAFEPKNLSALAYANGFTLWHYKSATDTAIQVDAGKADGSLGAPGYMRAARDMLRKGDFVFANVADGHGVFIVVENNDTVTALSNILNFGAVDAD
jgi:hypothetical protein